jgi:hypothetical protein
MGMKRFCVFLMGEGRWAESASCEGRWAESPESASGPSAGPEKDRDVKLNRVKGEAHSGKDMAEVHVLPGSYEQAGAWSAGLMEDTSPLGPGKVRDVGEEELVGLRDVRDLLLGPGKVRWRTHSRMQPYASVCSRSASILPTWLAPAILLVLAHQCFLGPSSCICLHACFLGTSSLPVFVRVGQACGECLPWIRVARAHTLERCSH